MEGCTKRLQSCKNMDPKSKLKQGKSKYIHAGIWAEGLGWQQYAS